MGHAVPCANISAVYHPRRPGDSPLFRLVRDHFTRFELIYEERFQHDYGFFRPVVADVVAAYLKCGDLKEGFARVRCPVCRHEFLLAFSCRGRWFCPSCHAKKVVQFGELLRENIIHPLPHRQYVFSIPIILRKFFLYNRKLLSLLSAAAAESLRVFFRTVLGLPEGVVGAVLAIQTFGDYARWHPHIHAIVADGLFRPSGVFHVMPRTDLRPLAELFRARVLARLKKAGLIDDSFIVRIMQWRHVSGFSVDNSVHVARGDDAGLTTLARYILRNPFSTAKLRYIPESGMVIYHSKMTHGKNRKNFALFRAEEFIAAITQHIPDKSFQLVRYHGWYSNRMRGERNKKTQATESLANPDDEIEIIDVSGYRPRRIPPPVWRECIKKIWEVDPLQCPRCKGEMKIISFITEAPVIRAILEHLHLWRDISQPRSPPICPELPAPQDASHHRHEHADDGWPGYEEPFISYD